MSEWKSRRFWTEARVADLQEGYGIALDGRPVKTPAKAPLAVPTRALAQAIAGEWDAQESEVVPDSMPLTRAANAAIDKVAHQRADVADMLADYGDSDLLCYRAGAPEGLVRRQAEAWDPLLDWAAAEMGARLHPVVGVMHRPQGTEALSALSSRVHAMDAFALTALHDLVSLSGSLIIGLAAVRDLQGPEALWRVSRIDETWQEELWGVDEEARAQAALKESDFIRAKRFHDLSRR